MTERRSGRGGLPIAGHLALLAALALVAAHVALFVVFVFLPPRPPDLVRSDLVFDAFKANFDRVNAGQTPTPDKISTWTIAAEPPPRAERRRGQRFARWVLARRLGLPMEDVRISFEPPPRHPVMFRIREEGARERGEEGLRRAERPPPAPEEGPPPLFSGTPRGVMLLSGYVIAAKTEDGRWLVMRQQRNAETIGWILRLALTSAATLALLLLVALLVARRIAEPIARFAAAVQRVGVDANAEPIPERGPRELRAAAQAVNAMQGRLRGLVAQRTEMLAAVAHDLRTPLMRLRLAAEAADPALRDKLAKETGEIDQLVSSFIAFARDDPTREARVRLDFSALVQSLVDDRVEAGAPVTLQDNADRIVLLGQPVGLKRLLDNLIDNAIKYGGVAELSLHSSQSEARVTVDDRGPGFTPEDRQNVFRPFVRGSASPAAPGAGLGLAAALEIARAHGGDLQIQDGPTGGARLVLTLPL